MSRTVIEPKHESIASQFRSAIRSGEIEIGAELPSEAALVEVFGVARGTIRQALATLRNEGLIQTSRGRRPVVCSTPLEQSIDDFFSFSSWVRAQGKVPGQRTLEISRRLAARGTDSPSDLPEGEYLVHLVRLRLIDGLPCMIERTTFHDSIGQQLLQFDPDSGSIFEYLIEQGAQLDQGTHIVDAVPANRLDAEQLEMEVGSPILRVRRTTTDASGQVLEYSEDRYRSDRASIRIHNSRANSASVSTASRRANTFAQS